MLHGMPSTAAAPLIDRALGTGYAVFAFLVALSGYLVNIRNLPGDTYQAYTDAMTVLAQTMARKNPSAFAGDFLFSQQNSDFLLNIMVYYLENLGEWFPSLPHALFALHFPMTLLHLAGFYLLGRRLGGNAIWGVLLGLSSFVCIEWPIGHWGLNAYPRSTGLYSAFLPYFLLAFFHFRERPLWWIGLFAMLGLLGSYIHQISTPFVAFSLWCGFWALRPAAWSWSRFSLHMLVVGTAFLLGMLPGLLPVLGHVSGSGQYQVDYREAMEAIRLLAFPLLTWYYHPWPGIKNTIIAIFSNPAMVLVLLFWVAGMLAMARGQLGERRHGLAMLLAAAGLIFIAIAPALLEAAWAFSQHRYLLLFDAPRTLIYLVPMVLIGAFFIARQLELRWPRLGLLLAALITLSWWFAGTYGPLSHIENLRVYARCLAAGGLTCEPTPENEIAFTLAMRKHIPQGGRVFSHGHKYRLKVMAERPLVYSKKDFQLSYYISKARMVEGYRIHQRLRKIDTEPDPVRRIAAVKAVAQELGAEYFVLSRQKWAEVHAHQGEVAALFKETLYQDEVGALFRM